MPLITEELFVNTTNYFFFLNKFHTINSIIKERIIISIIEYVKDCYVSQNYSIKEILQ